MRCSLHLHALAVLLLASLPLTALTAQAQSQNPRRSATVLSPPSPNSSSSGTTLASRPDFVGDSACRDCHQQVADSYAHTNHHLTSQTPSKNSISGSFSPPGNVLKTRDPDLQFRMEARETGFFETAVFWQPPDQKTRSERIDFVTGSGAKGQTYLYWRGNQLFELPVSYWTDLHAWVNSPGFPDGVADFDRPIVPRCLECHATYFSALPSHHGDNFYKKSGFALGISCERCHGPGRQHIQNQPLRKSAAPAASNASPSIVNPSVLSRERQIEVCAQCHGGIGQSIAPAFSYQPGLQLDRYIRLQSPDPSAPVDVHGNQVALTQRSRCFQSSAMTCTTCHNVHTPERTAASYSTKCLECHKPTDCGEFAKLGEKLKENCIDCHMPVQQSNLIISNLSGTPVKARMRNHWIKVYPSPTTP